MYDVERNFKKNLKPLAAETCRRIYTSSILLGRLSPTAGRRRRVVSISGSRSRNSQTKKEKERDLIHVVTMGQVLARLLEVFYTKKLDIVVIGLENRCV